MVWYYVLIDVDWNIVFNFMMLDWFCMLLMIVVFNEIGDIMSVKFKWILYEVIDVEIVCFKGVMDGFGSGWGVGYVIFDEILEEMKV